MPRRAPALGSRARALMWSLVAIGLVGRVVLAFKTYGVIYDIDSFKAVRSALSSDPLHVYSIVNGHPNNRWPYPPAFFAWIVAAGGLETLTGFTFQGLVQLPQIGADFAIAWLVQDHLGRRGASERVRVAAVALVALGPTFWIISGFHGQIDSLAILPAVAALWWWERAPAGGRRALVCGALVGLAASLKTVPIFMLAALLPSVRSRREAAALVAPALAVPLLALAPFLIADGSNTLHSFRSHRSLPGFGGISLLVQPGLADQWLHQRPHVLSPTSRFLFDHEPVIVALLMAPFVVLALVRRVAATESAAVLWALLLVLNTGFGFDYVIWALPFVLMAGYVWQVAAVEAVLFPPAAMVYWHPFGFASTATYDVIMLAAWLVVTPFVLRMAARLLARPSPRVAAGEAAL